MLRDHDAYFFMFSAILMAHKFKKRISDGGRSENVDTRAKTVF